PVGPGRLTTLSAWPELAFARFVSRSARWAIVNAFAVTFTGFSSPNTGVIDPATSSAAHARAIASSRPFHVGIDRILGLRARIGFEARLADALCLGAADFDRENLRIRGAPVPGARTAKERDRTRLGEGVRELEVVRLARAVR